MLNSFKWLNSLSVIKQHCEIFKDKEVVTVHFYHIVTSETDLGHFKFKTGLVSIIRLLIGL